MKRIIAVVAVLTWAGVLLVIGGNAADGNPGPVCGSPDAGDCFTANGTPGCGDATCCELVCGQLPYCCEVGWDGVCADRALFDAINGTDATIGIAFLEFFSDDQDLFYFGIPPGVMMIEVTAVPGVATLAPLALGGLVPGRRRRAGQTPGCA